MESPVDTLGFLLEQLGLERDDALATPSWNGEPLGEVYPWGTIRTPTPEANRATADELTAEEQARIAEHVWPFVDEFDYAGFLGRELEAPRTPR